MKRLFLIALFGLICVQQTQANDLIPASLVAAMPSRNTLLTCAAAPAIGFAAGTVWTLCRAGIAHTKYYATNQYANCHKNSFINTVLNGGHNSFEAPLGSMHNIGQS